MNPKRERIKNIRSKVTMWWKQYECESVIRYNLVSFQTSLVVDQFESLATNKPTCTAEAIWIAYWYDFFVKFGI